MIAVVGPKQVEYGAQERLLSLGTDATKSARRLGYSQPDEIDQGEIQNQAVDFIKREKVKMMKAQGLTEKMKRETPEEYQGQMNNLMATVKRMAIKEYVEA